MPALFNQIFGVLAVAFYSKPYLCKSVLSIVKVCKSVLSIVKMCKSVQKCWASCVGLIQLDIPGGRAVPVSQCAAKCGKCHLLQITSIWQLCTWSHTLPLRMVIWPHSVTDSAYCQSHNCYGQTRTYHYLEIIVLRAPGTDHSFWHCTHCDTWSYTLLNIWRDNNTALENAPLLTLL